MSFDLVDVELAHANGQRALRGLSLSAQPGERLAVIGPSGAGKTTLLRVLGASLKPTAGRLQTLGSDPWRLSARELRQLRSRVGMVHQAAPVPPRLRAVTAVLAGRLGQWSLGRSLWSLVAPHDIEGAHAVLARLGLGDRLFERCDRLSGGQLQRVGIARVLYQQPALLLADEPVSALDPSSADFTLGQLVEQSRATGATLVASLHAVQLALKWFPRVVGLRDGAVVFDLPAKDVSPELLQDLYGHELAGSIEADASATPQVPLPYVGRARAASAEQAASHAPARSPDDEPAWPNTGARAESALQRPPC